MRPLKCSCPPDISRAPAGGRRSACVGFSLPTIPKGAHVRGEPVDPLETLKSNSRPAGAPVSVAEQLTRKGTENTLRQGLRNRWVAPAEEFARLEDMILKLLDRIQNRDLEAIDRALKIVDRLDRHHGFTKAKRVPDSTAKRTALDS
jgi:hypothetical protein